MLTGTVTVEPAAALRLPMLRPVLAKACSCGCTTCAVGAALCATGASLGAAARSGVTTLVAMRLGMAAVGAATPGVAAKRPSAMLAVPWPAGAMPAVAAAGVAATVVVAGMAAGVAAAGTAAGTPGTTAMLAPLRPAGTTAWGAVETLTTLVTVLEFKVPSLTCQLNVRLTSAPELVAFAL